MSQYKVSLKIDRLHLVPIGDGSGSYTNSRRDENVAEIDFETSVEDPTPKNKTGKGIHTDFGVSVASISASSVSIISICLWSV